MVSVIKGSLGSRLGQESGREVWHPCLPLPISFCLRLASKLNHRELFKCRQTNTSSKQRGVCTGDNQSHGWFGCSGKQGLDFGTDGV